MQSNIDLNEYLRLPKTGESLMGFGRSALYGFIRTGAIKAKVIRKPGSRKGFCFVQRSELHRLIEEAPDAREAFTAK